MALSEHRKAYMEEYRRKNAERIKAQRAEYRRTHKLERSAYQQEYRRRKLYEKWAVVSPGEQDLAPDAEKILIKYIDQ